VPDDHVFVVRQVSRGVGHTISLAGERSPELIGCAPTRPPTSSGRQGGDTQSGHSVLTVTGDSHRALFDSRSTVAGGSNCVL
jgi:hypothetical protein